MFGYQADRLRIDLCEELGKNIRYWRIGNPQPKKHVAPNRFDGRSAKLHKGACRSRVIFVLRHEFYEFFSSHFLPMHSFWTRLSFHNFRAFA